MDIDSNFNSKDQVLQIRDAIPSEGSITIQSIHKRKDDTEFPVEIRIALLYINEQQHIIDLCRILPNANNISKKYCCIILD